MAGQLINRGEDTWLIRIYLGRVNGKRRYHNETFHGTEKQANRRRRELLTQADQGLLAAGGGEIRTVAQYAEHWLSTIVRRSVRERTATGYRGKLERYVLPHLGACDLRAVTPARLRELIDALEPELAPSTIREVHSVARNMLGAAVDDGILTRNPARARSVTRYLPKVEKVERTLVPPERVPAFLEAARADRLYGLWVLALLGLRPEEALALRWADVRDGRLHVRRVLNDRADDWPSYLPPKTDRSARSLKLPAMAVEALEVHRRRQLEERLAAESWEENDLVICRPDGSPYRQASLHRPFKQLLAAAELPDMRLYDLRHSCATLLLASGETLESVKQWLGHSTITLTSDTYGGLAEGIQDRSAAALDRWATGG